MKVFSVFGYSGSGKTTIVESLVKELKERNYSIGSIKEIHYEAFKMDAEGTNTDRHRRQGAEPVTARGNMETDIMYSRKLSLPEILYHYNQDYVVCEGLTDYNLPRILAAKSIEELEERWDTGIFAVSGRVAKVLGQEYKGVPVINVLENPKELANLVIEKVFDLLPDVDENCCNACGYGCRGLTDMIVKGKAQRDDCIQKSNVVKLFIDGNEIPMVPFVEKMIHNITLGAVSELKGYKKNSEIIVKIDHRGSYEKK
ncbi:MAG TPA: molybdopterin-guanine dinucleotide biosynthesis protein B [Clostridia bacterium]|nr:molybdopterin-guanine dinucleotide biosynthesis protein B [Clostridia bacterium]